VNVNRSQLGFVALALVVLVSAIAAVYAKHQNRQMFMQLQTLTAERDRLDVDWSRLQIEQSTLSTHARVDQLARTQMNMHGPDATGLQVLAP
jgi:cell division protein FtsL